MWIIMYLDKWEVSPPEDCMVNLDGSSLGNLGNVGYGGLLRYENEVWLHGFLGYGGSF
jgi:ribonuclease HI